MSIGLFYSPSIFFRDVFEVHSWKVHIQAYHIYSIMLTCSSNDRTAQKLSSTHFCTMLVYHLIVDQSGTKN